MEIVVHLHLLSDTEAEAAAAALLAAELVRQSQSALVAKADKIDFIYRLTRNQTCVCVYVDPLNYTLANTQAAFNCFAG